VWFPTIQFTCKVYNAATNVSIWRSVNVSNFLTPPNPKLDKRSSKADEFAITHCPATSTKPEHYIIQANLSKDLQVSLEVTRPDGVPGFKIGRGPQGGYSNYGVDEKKPEGYMIHRFWPRTLSEGHVIHKGRALTVKGPGMFVHAIQGMRPNLLACRWNFANFQSDALGGVSAIQMEFTTLDSHGRTGPGSGGVSVNVGGIVLGEKLVAVTAETKWPDEPYADDAPVISRATHLNAVHDSDTGYSQPSEIVFRWAAPALNGAGSVDAKMHVDVGPPSAPKGLIEKVDLLAEIPYVVKMALNYVAGTKPYIYQVSFPALQQSTTETFCGSGSIRSSYSCAGQILYFPGSRVDLK
jgi:hypothetical protein